MFSHNALATILTSAIFLPFFADLKSLKFFALSRVFFSLADDEKKIICEYERDPLAIDAKFLLHVTQEVTKIDVKDLTVCEISKDN